MAQRSALIHRFMVASIDRFFRRHMNALRIARWGEPAVPPGAGPLVVYSNHPAWWDAAVYILAADRLMAGRESYAPIDAEMLERYGVFRRIGAFGVDLGSPRGAADFLRASAEVLARRDRALWVAAQGRFADVRERPLGLRPGVAHLPGLAPECLVLPLAIEYGFWQERGAEAFLAFGAPLPGEVLLAKPKAMRRALMEDALGAAMDRLAGDVRSRDPARFRSLLEGRTGVGGIYDGWRRLTAAARGRAFDPSHGGRAR